MTAPDGPLWLHLPQGRYRISDEEDPDALLEALRGDDGQVVAVEDESGTPGVVVLRPGAAPVALIGERGRQGRPRPEMGPSRYD